MVICLFDWVKVSEHINILQSRHQIFNTEHNNEHKQTSCTRVTQIEEKVTIAMVDSGLNSTAFCRPATLRYLEVDHDDDGGEAQRARLEVRGLQARAEVKVAEEVEAQDAAQHRLHHRIHHPAPEDLALIDRYEQ